jgi:hypothetical protein
VSYSAHFRRVLPMSMARKVIVLARGARTK